jgi:hypothetical protein
MTNVLINYVLDKSGSMYNVRDDTIGGFNQYLAEQRRLGRRLGQRTRVSLTLFDTSFEHRYIDADIDKVSRLSSKTYQPGGNTALYDAIGSNVRAVEKRKPEGMVLFVIQTDGLENSSREWTRKAVFDLITEKREKADWQFVFLGADQDAYAAGETIGVAPSSTLSYRSAQSPAMYAALAESTDAWRSGRTKSMDVSVHQEELDAEPEGPRRKAGRSK